MTLTQLQDRLYKYIEHLEFIASEEWLDKFWEYRDSLFNIWTYSIGKLEKEISKLEKEIWIS
jgi:hypothetical protein